MEIYELLPLSLIPCGIYEYFILNIRKICFLRPLSVRYFCLFSYDNLCKRGILYVYILCICNRSHYLLGLRCNIKESSNSLEIIGIIMHRPIQLASLILTGCVLCHADLAMSSGPSRNLRIKKRDAPVFGAQPRIGDGGAINFPGSGYGQNYGSQDAVGNQNSNKQYATAGAFSMSSLGGFRPQNGPIMYENRFPYSKDILPNTGPIDLTKGISMLGMPQPMNGPPVSTDADKIFSPGFGSSFGTGFQNWNLKNGNSDLKQLGSVWPINPLRNIDSFVDAISDGLAKDSVAPVAKVTSDESEAVGKIPPKGENIQIDDLVEDLNSAVGLGVRPLSAPMIRGRQRNGRRRLGGGRRNDSVTKLDIVTTVQSEEDKGNVSEETRSEIEASVSTEDDATTEVFKDIMIDGLVDTTDGGPQVTEVMESAQQVSVTPTEGVSSFMDETADRLCLPPAAEDIKMALSSLVSNGSVDMTPLPNVISKLVSRIRGSYPELTSSEVTTQVFGELCTALLHILPSSTVGEVNYDTIPETTQIISLMLQSGVD